MYIFHHQSLVIDTFYELHRLTSEILARFSLERLLPSNHPHFGMLERRWDEDGI
jgi:hypothetical protein